MTNEDTICAVATAAGEAGIGIIRVSGDKALKVAETLFRSAGKRKIAEIHSHEAVYGHIIDPAKPTETIDEALLLVMRGPHSYTAEDVVEFQCHGGSVALRRVLELAMTAGARIAEPGEFTKRAFLNGRLDLAQAEAVMGVIRAKTDQSLKQAVRHLSGELSQKITELRKALLALIAHLEATIDFPDEDIDQVEDAMISETIAGVEKQVELLLRTAHSGKMLKDGMNTVIIGKPNVGKSSLLNAFLREQRAIVTDIPGTTRDSIEEYVNLKGIPLKIIDTAGIRETDDLVEKIGVKKTKELLIQADLVLLLLDSSRPLSDEDQEIMKLVKDQQGFVLLNKTDLPQLTGELEITKFLTWPVISMSLVTGEGIEKLEEQIVSLVYGGAVSAEAAFIATVRQEECLEQVQLHLGAALNAVQDGLPVDCSIIDIKNAWEKLGEITGETVGEDLIDQIFSQFCIGK